MSNHLAISPIQAADRLAIRELVEAYAHCADRRDAKGQMSLDGGPGHVVTARGCAVRLPPGTIPVPSRL